MTCAPLFKSKEFESTLTDLAVYSLGKGFSSSLKNAVKEFGSLEVIDEMRPQVKQVFQSGLFLDAKASNIEKWDAETLLMIYLSGQVTAVPLDKIDYELSEVGAIGTVYECAFQDSVPEVCLLLSHYGSEELCRVMNPEYECVFTNHLTNGDPYCRYVFKKKSQKMIDLKSVDTVKSRRLEIRSTDKVILSRKVAMRRMLWNGITSVTIQLGGAEKARNMLYPNAWKIGTEMANIVKDKTSKVEWNAETIGYLVHSLRGALNQRGKTNISLSKEFVMEVVDCSCQIYPQEFCGQMGQMSDGLVQTLNPKYEFFYNHMITKGEKGCNWTIRKKNR